MKGGIIMKIKLNELVTFLTGANSSRVKEDFIIYSINDFDEDIKVSYSYTKNDFEIVDSKDYFLKKGDVLFSVTRNKVGIVSDINEGKYMISNFVKCCFDKTIIYPWYFCYLINESDSISSQIRRLQQGCLVSINRLPINSIGELEIELIDYDKQRQIGEIYRNIIVREKLALQEIEYSKQISLEIIKRVDNN